MSEPTENTKRKILLLDDDTDVLDLYQQVLLELPCRPEVHIATSGARAMALLDSERFDLLVSDLKMPKMDGLQVIGIVRRKFPELRMIVLTGVTDEEMRARAYSMGIDLYLQKPGNKQEIAFFMDCIDTLLDKEKRGAGFRGIQSKSMVDLIQLECLSGSSSVLKITNGKLEGKIWINHGELIDASTPDAEGEDAFKRIFSWKGGAFEMMPAEPEHPRKIMTSYQGLLLDTVQTQDEAQAVESAQDSGETASSGDTQFLRNVKVGRIQGVEFTLRLSRDKSVPIQHSGLENPEPLAQWLRQSAQRFEDLGDKFEFGPLREFNLRGLQRQLGVLTNGDDVTAVAMLPSVTREQAANNIRKVLDQWAS